MMLNTDFEHYYQQVRRQQKRDTLIWSLLLLSLYLASGNLAEFSLMALWQALRQADPARWPAVWPLLTAPPLSEVDASASALQQVFANRRQDPAAEAAAQVHEQRWASQVL